MNVLAIDDPIPPPIDLGCQQHVLSVQEDVLLTVLCTRIPSYVLLGSRPHAVSHLFQVWSCISFTLGLLVSTFPEVLAASDEKPQVIDHGPSLEGSPLWRFTSTSGIQKYSRACWAEENRLPWKGSDEKY